MAVQWQKTGSAALGRRGSAGLAAGALVASVALGSIAVSPATSGAGATACSPSLNKLTAPGCQRVFADNGTNPDPISIWGSIDCQKSSRVSQIYQGGDTQRSSTGKRPGNSTFRRLRVLDGDNFWGERCELGRNGSHTAPNVLYHEGQHRITFISIRLPKGFPIGTNRWQGVLQMKQTQPAANGAGSPVLTLSAFNGKWLLSHSKYNSGDGTMQQLWSAPARTGVWTRFAFDVVYSRHRSRGRVRLYVDRNRDGDATDAAEQSPVFHTFTLKREIKGGSNDGIAPGQSIPSHLRVGIYHDSSIRCPAPHGCPVDVDNVQVVSPN